MSETTLIRDALRLLEIDRLVLAVHDLMLPGSPAEDLGRGAPGSRSAIEFVDFGLGFGFNALQFGPQGETSRDNPSPYDGAAFSRDPSGIAVEPLQEEALGALLMHSEIETLASSRPGPNDRAQHRFAYDATRALLRTAWARLREGDTPARRSLLAELSAFTQEAAPWLERDGLFVALTQEHGDGDPSHWPTLDRLLWHSNTDPMRATARRAELAERYREVLTFNGFMQWVTHRQHRLFQTNLRERGLALFGDLQIGLSPRDAWSWRAYFLDDWVMGAPPSRTTSHGQPWGYPVFNPLVTSRRFAGESPPALELVRLRLTKALTDYDGLRIDHPHGWVCPWVYSAAEAKSEAAVSRGARLYESPDSPALARFAIARSEQLAWDRTRFDDGWVRTLDTDQVNAYAELTDEILACADRLRRPRELLLWELLSTQPYPLEQVLKRQALGRFRVTQKVRLDDPNDGYRSEHANPQDWMMFGNHDTEPIWTVVQRWKQRDELGRRAAYMASRLRPDGPAREALSSALAQDVHLVAQAQFADLFACRARQVSIFVSDWLGETRSYNRPGVVDTSNWSVRVPAAYPDVYRSRLESAAALDMPLVLALALEAQGPLSKTQRPLISALRAASRSSSRVPTNGS